MREADEQPGSMFRYVSLEDRVPADHPLRSSRHIIDAAPARFATRFGTLYVEMRPALDSSLTAVASVGAAGAVRHPQRASTNGAVGLQPALSLVRGLGIDGCDLPVTGRLAQRAVVSAFVGGRISANLSLLPPVDRLSATHRRRRPRKRLTRGGHLCSVVARVSVSRCTVPSAEWSHK